MRVGRWAVPPTWAWTSMGEVAEVVGGATPSTTDPANFGGKIPWLTPADMAGHEGKHIAHGQRFITDKGLEASGARWLPKGAVLFSSRAPIGYTAITSQSVTTNQGFKSFVPKEGVTSDYVYYWLSSAKAIAEEFASGTTFLELSGAKASLLPFPIAPSGEQTRIVAKLEELLSDLDAGVAELEAAKAKLAQYRRSLLKSAVEGALTADWRREHAGEGETGEALLQRILTERRARWEARQRAKFEQQGKVPPKGWQSAYLEPVAPDTRDLRELPSGWTWATLSQVGWLDRGRSKHRPRDAAHLYGGSHPFVQTGDIRRADTFLHTAEASYSDAGLAQSRLWPSGTMCITIAANIGKTAILAMDACFPDSVVGFLSASNDVSVRYVEYFMRTAQGALEAMAPATAQKNINLETLDRVAVPLPPRREQTKIVEVLDDVLLGARNQAQSIQTALNQSAAQRQNLLRAAFSGRLVPQDPNDEPASLLLERIRAARSAQSPPGKPRGRPRRVAA